MAGGAATDGVRKRSSKRGRGKKRDRHEVWGESGEEGGEEVEGGEERATKMSRLTWSKAVRSRDTRRQYAPLHFSPLPRVPSFLSCSLPSSFSLLRVLLSFRSRFLYSGVLGDRAMEELDKASAVWEGKMVAMVEYAAATLAQLKAAIERQHQYEADQRNYQEPRTTHILCLNIPNSV